MTNLPPNNLRKEFSSLALYVQRTRRQLLNIIAYIEGLNKKFLFYQLAASQHLSQTKAEEILTEMSEWPREMQTRTELAFRDFQEERTLLNRDFPAALREQLETVAFLFSRLLEKSNGRKSSEESIDHFEIQVNVLQKNPTSKETINQVKEVLQNIHHVFVRLLDAVHKEEKDLAGEERIIDQISGNNFIEDNKEKILTTVKAVFDNFLEDYLYLKYGTTLHPMISAKRRIETVDHRQTTFLTVMITLEGEVGQPSWNAHLRYDAQGHFFEAVLGQRRGFQFIPEEQRSYTSSEQMLREFPTELIQYIFNGEIMKEIIKQKKA